MASAQGEVIHAHRGERPDRWVGQGADQPEDAAAAGHQAEAVGQPGTRATGKRHPDLLQRLAKQRTTPSVSAGQPADLLGERADRAAHRVAEEPADP
ncbi:hypothetical protein GCM10023176_56940 [Micromonospora coerulea]|uniref:Uncharacterized protein n=1 Tax=Micromonospora coerulea TaxID=47856 RepID=A0ABP8T4R5_9ACTN